MVSDDEDSGNDEPPENQNCNKDRQDDFEDLEESDKIDLDRPRPVQPRNLNQYLDLLSQPRDSDMSQEKIYSLPVEVLLAIFSYLDDLSLWNVSEVCKHWKNILEVYTSQKLWEKYTKERFPLFQQISNIPNWLHVSKPLDSLKYN